MGMEGHVRVLQWALRYSSRKSTIRAQKFVHSMVQVKLKPDLGMYRSRPFLTWLAVVIESDREDSANFFSVINMAELHSSG